MQKNDCASIPSKALGFFRLTCPRVLKSTDLVAQLNNILNFLAEDE